MQSVYFPLNLFFFEGMMCRYISFCESYHEVKSRTTGIWRREFTPWLAFDSILRRHGNHRTFFQKSIAKRLKIFPHVFFSKSSSFFIKMGKFKNGTFLWKSSRNSKDVQTLNEDTWEQISKSLLQECTF